MLDKLLNNTDTKVTLLIVLWILDKLAMFFWFNQ